MATPEPPQSVVAKARRVRMAPPALPRLLLVTLGLVILMAAEARETVPHGGTSLLAMQSTPATPSFRGTPVSTPAVGADEHCSAVLGVGDPADACVAFVNAVPGSSPVDYTIAGTVDALAPDVAAGEFADFVAVPGETDLEISVTPGDASDVVLAADTVRLAAGTASVIVLEQQYDQAGPTLLAVPLNLAPLSTGQARVVFHHAVTDAADLSVLGLGTPSDAPILPGETTDPLDVDAGRAAITVVPANDTQQELATLDLSLEPDLSYLVILGGTTGDQSVTVIYAAAPVALV